MWKLTVLVVCLSAVSASSLYNKEGKIERDFNVKTLLSFFLNAYNQRVGNVVCPGGEAECPSGNTCCPISDNMHGCCPVPNAVCCDDLQHCCPETYTCQSGSGTCVKDDGTWVAQLKKIPAQRLRVSS